MNIIRKEVNSLSNNSGITKKSKCKKKETRRSKNEMSVKNKKKHLSLNKKRRSNFMNNSRLNMSFKDYPQSKLQRIKNASNEKNMQKK